jgi:hypothetical protein
MQKKTHSVLLNNYMANDENKNNSKKKVKKPDNNPKQTNQPLPPGVDPAIARVIKDALLIHVKSHEERQSKLNELEAMYSTCQEFMNSFIILGYDLNGQPIAPLIHAHNQQEADALGSYLSKFINHNIKEINPESE